MAIDSQAVELIRAEVLRAVAAVVEPLEKKLDEQDEWMNGLFLALQDLCQALAKERSPVLAAVIPGWEKIADQYDLACKGLYPDVSPERLEPRKLLYRILLTTGALRQLDE